MSRSILDIPSKFGLLALHKMIMRSLFAPVLFVAFILLGDLAYSQEGSSVTQSVTVEVKPITKIAVTGNPRSLVISDAGSAPVSVNDNTTTYSIVTNLDNMKIVASINDRMPIGTQLMISLGSSSGTSSGNVDISDAGSPVDVVNGIGRGLEHNQPINYVFAANAEAGEVPLSTRVITLTLTD